MTTAASVAHEGNGKSRPASPPDHTCVMRERMNEQEELTGRLLGEVGVIAKHVGHDRHVDEKTGYVTPASGMIQRLDTIEARLGDAGDPVRGIDPSGLYGVAIRLTHQIEELNDALAGDVRPKLDSLIDEEEKTEIQSREAIVARAHKSESDAEKLRAELQAMKDKDEAATKAKIAADLEAAKQETAKVRALVVKVAVAVAVVFASGAGSIELLRKLIPILLP